MGRHRVMFFASLSRIGFGLIGVLALPLVYPAMAPHRPLFTGYIAIAIVEELLIWKQLGGELRAFCAGLVDLAIITWIVHRAGSVATPLVSLYFFSGIMNALAVSFRVGLSQAVLGSLAYGGVVIAESLGALPYGVDAPAWMPRPTPRLSEASMAVVLVTILLFASTNVVGVLRRAVESRQRDLARANERLEEISQRDPLTGLYNRRRMLEQLSLELARARRGQRFALLMLDLDRFKRVNDEQGHPRGDQLLTEVGAALLAAARATDVASRYGGDEFVVILHGADASTARVAADRVCAAVRDIGLRFGEDRPVTASVGVAIANEHDTEASLLKRADESAYRAKRSGGDRVELAR